MDKGTVKHHKLILPRDDVVVVTNYIFSSVPRPRLDAQLASRERFRFAMKEIYKRYLPCRNFISSVVIVPAEKIAIFAGGDLSFHSRNRKWFNPQFRQDSRQRH